MAKVHKSRTKTGGGREVEGVRPIDAEMESATADYIFQLLLETLQEADLPLGKNELLNQRFL